MKAGTVLQQISTNTTRTQCKHESIHVQLQPHSRDWKPATVTECLDYNRYKVQIDFMARNTPETAITSSP